MNTRQLNYSSINSLQYWISCILFLLLFAQILPISSLCVVYIVSFFENVSFEIACIVTVVCGQNVSSSSTPSSYSPVTTAFQSSNCDDNHILAIGTFKNDKCIAEPSSDAISTVIGPPLSHQITCNADGTAAVQFFTGSSCFLDAWLNLES